MFSQCVLGNDTFDLFKNLTEHLASRPNGYPNIRRDYHHAKSVVMGSLTEKPKDEVDDEDEKLEAAEAAPARHLDDFAPPLLLCEFR